MLHIIDSEKIDRDSITWLATARSMAVTSYESGDAFLAAVNSEKALDTEGECVLMDVTIPVMNGIASFDSIALQDVMRRFPVIFLACRDDFMMAVNMLKRGAFDFFEKPFNGNTLMDRVEEALAASRQVKVPVAIPSRLAVLSAREREVLDLILAGNMNKVIGDKLGISTRTVEVHRKHIFHKTHVRNAIELASLLK
jgi:two-component system response regulator DctR